MTRPPSAAFRRFRLGARPHGRHLDGLSRDAVRVLHREAHVVLGVRLEVENTAGKPRGHRKRRAGDPLATLAQQRKSRPPRRLSGRPVLDLDGRIAIVVAGDVPLEAEADERRGLDDKLAGDGRVVLRAEAGKRRDHERDADDKCVLHMDRQWVRLKADTVLKLGTRNRSLGV